MSLNHELWNIERHASWVRRHAEDLSMKLPFETRAEEELERAEKTLRDALAKVTRTRRHMIYMRTEQSDAA